MTFKGRDKARNPVQANLKYIVIVRLKRFINDE
jgi:hypothetical protein